MMKRRTLSGVIVALALWLTPNALAQDCDCDCYFSSDCNGGFCFYGEQGFTVELSGSAQRAEQGRLYDRCFGKTDGERVLPWRYDGCPHGRVLAPGAFDEGGSMVASYACSPRRVHECPRGTSGGV